MTFSVPLAAPTAVGEKVTPTVQLAPAAMLVPQGLLDRVKGGPLTVIDTFSAVLSRFVIETVRAEFAPWTTVPKAKLVGEKVTGAVPLPESETVWFPAL